VRYESAAGSAAIRHFDSLSRCAIPISSTSPANAALLISDSGGLQEEAPHLGVPLLVPRLNTERPEGIATGFVRLVAVETGAIVRAAFEMLATPPRNRWRSMTTRPLVPAIRPCGSSPCWRPWSSRRQSPKRRTWRQRPAYRGLPRQVPLE
jgi:hypothetical protein